jgi:hypothetical protein
MNILIYGLTGAGVFILFIIIYSYIETHYKDRTYRQALEKRLKTELEIEADYRQKLLLAIPVTNESFPSKKTENIHHVSINTHGL